MLDVSAAAAKLSISFLGRSFASVLGAQRRKNDVENALDAAEWTRHLSGAVSKDRLSMLKVAYEEKCVAIEEQYDREARKFQEAHEEELNALEDRERSLEREVAHLKEKKRQRFREVEALRASREKCLLKRDGDARARAHRFCFDASSSSQGTASDEVDIFEDCW